MAVTFRNFSKIRRAVLTNQRLFTRLNRNLSLSTRLCSVNPERDDNLYTSEHWQMKKSLKQIIEKDINPFVDEWEREKQFPAHQVFKTLGDAGFLGVNKPTEYGGLGLDYSYSLAVLEELGSINCGAIPMAVGVQTDMATPALARFGNPEIKEQFLRPSIAGDFVSAIGVSEAGAGSDVASIKTTAKKDGDDYVINGSKMWITNAFQADWICLLVNTSQGPAHRSKSLICVPMDSPGVHRARKIDKLGMWCSDTGELYFEDVRVPQKYLIGEENQGFTYQMIQFQEERICSAAITLHQLQRLIDSTAEYTKQRMAFGRPLLDNQSIHFRLAELQTELECLKSLVYRTVGNLVKGEDVTMLASMCKLKVGRLSREVTDSCLQYWGGMGFTNDVLVSRLYRDMRLGSIGGGADEVMLSIICKLMGTLPEMEKKPKK